MKTGVVGLWLAGSVAWAATGGPPELSGVSGVEVVLGSLSEPAARETQLWRVTTEKTQDITVVNHAPGMLPRGTWDATHDTGWLVVADAASRNGAPARLIAVGGTGGMRDALRDVTAGQKPVLLEDGSALVVSDERGHQMHRVQPGGKVSSTAVLRAGWILPAGLGEGGALCAVLQDGPRASLVCGSSEKWSVDGVVRDLRVTADGALGTVMDRQGWHVTRWDSQGAHRLVTLSGPVDLVVAAGVAAWNGAAGEGVQLLVDGKIRNLLPSPGAVVVPQVFSPDGRWLVVRLDSVDSHGRVDGRMPARWRVLDVRDGGVGRLNVHGQLVEVYGVRGVTP